MNPLNSTINSKPKIGSPVKDDEGLTVSALQITALVQIIIVFVIPLAFNIVIVVLIIIELNKKVVTPGS